MSNAWLQEPISGLERELIEAARNRQGQLTKPPGSLGRLENLGIQLAAMQRTQRPVLDPVWIVVFAGDHGVTAEAVSAYPQAVTAEMVRNFVRGGAAISVLAAELNAHLEVFNVGTVRPLDPMPGVTDRRLGPGTANLAHGPAMRTDQLDRALGVGKEAAERAAAAGARLFIGGEMGIGNTTPASAVACALLECLASEIVGPGTGLDAAGVDRKATVVRTALRRCQTIDPLAVLEDLGGFEIAALTGAYLRCGQLRMPVLVDGFISTVSALAAVRLNAALAPWLFYAHHSAEPGHRKVLEALQARPLLDLEMRLGEASGAAVALPLLRAAAALHGKMATFAEAEVSSP